MPEALELPLHVGDVLERPRLGVHAALDGGVLGRQAERVPAERVQDVEAAHALHARDDVADHVVADVSDVGVPGGIGEHLQAVELRPGVVFSDFEGPLPPPAFLPFLLDCLGFVVGHDPLIIVHARRVPAAARASATARAPRGAATAATGALGAPSSTEIEASRQAASAVSS